MLCRKIAAFLSAAVLCFCLCGCQPSKAIAGSYETQLDISDVFNSRYTDATDLENYSITGLYVTQSLTLKEDGTYKYSVAEEEAEAVCDSAVALTKSALGRYYERIIEEAGLQIEVQAYLAAVGTDLDAVVGEMKVEEEIEAIIEKLNGEGSFTAERKSLFAKKITGRLSSFSGFEDYEFKDNTLKVNSQLIKKEIFYEKQ